MELWRTRAYDGTDNTSADYVSGKVGSEAKDFRGAILQLRRL